MRVDLHTHSNASDGVLQPEQVWQMAQAAHLDYFALTDHDTLEGFYTIKYSIKALEELNAANNTRAGDESGNKMPQFISGVEISTAYEHHSVHVVGLNFDEKNSNLNALLEENQAIRADRAAQIAYKLDFLKLENLLEEVMAFNGCSEWQLARPHFARYLVEKGCVDSEQKAFKQWLGQGKRAFVKTQWPDLMRVVQTITQAGGVAVLAHPMKYSISRTQLRGLIDAFAQAGGQAVEMVYLRQKINDTRYLQRLCEKHGLHASAGSDFHDPAMTWTAVGKVAALPQEAKGVWELFS